MVKFKAMHSGIAVGIATSVALASLALGATSAVAQDLGETLSSNHAETVAIGFAKPTGEVDTSRTVDVTVIIPTVAGVVDTLSGYKVELVGYENSEAGAKTIGTHSGVTDNSGTLSIKGIKQGTWVIRARHDDPKAMTFNDLTVQLPLVDKDGNWQYDVEVTLKPKIESTTTVTTTVSKPPQPPVTETPEPSEPETSETPKVENPQQQQTQAAQSRVERAGLPVTGVQLGMILMALAVSAGVGTWLLYMGVVKRRRSDDSADS